jgi:O-acetyl-ADP-ribose deacetylase (regulator of RNase III)
MRQQPGGAAPVKTAPILEVVTGERAEVVERTTGDILSAEAEALVNPVNCVGVMGRGLALQFRRAFPENSAAYQAACGRGEVRAGEMFVYPLPGAERPRFIINFPTKQHWRAPSRMEDIEAGLAALVEEVRRRGIRSVAVPPLGCGLGGLDWAEVRPRIEEAFAALPDVRVLLYEPAPPPVQAAASGRQTGAPEEGGW